MALNLLCTCLSRQDFIHLYNYCISLIDTFVNVSNTAGLKMKEDEVNLLAQSKFSS